MKSHDLSKSDIRIIDEDQELYVEITGTHQEKIEEGDEVTIIRNRFEILYTVNYISYDKETNNLKAGLLYLKKN